MRLHFLETKARVADAMPNKSMDVRAKQRIEALYAEFADEDRELAEAGLPEYAASLELEDKA